MQLPLSRLPASCMSAWGQKPPYPLSLHCVSLNPKSAQILRARQRNVQKVPKRDIARPPLGVLALPDHLLPCDTGHETSTREDCLQATVVKWLRTVVCQGDLSR